MELLTGLELINELREDILDSAEDDSLWTNDALLRNLNKAEREIAIRTLCLSDASTAGIALIPAATADWNALNQKILFIDSVFVVGRRLRFIPEATLKVLFGDYASTVTGDPLYYVLANNQIRFVPNIATPSSLAMTVRRLPLAEITLTGSPEVPEHYYAALLQYAAYLCYTKKDSQTLDPVAAANHLQAFTSMVGPEVSLKEQYDRKHAAVWRPAPVRQVAPQRPNNPVLAVEPRRD